MSLYAATVCHQTLLPSLLQLCGLCYCTDPAQPGTFNHCLKRVKLSLTELHQISTNFNNFWHNNGKVDKNFLRHMRMYRVLLSLQRLHITYVGQFLLSLSKVKEKAKIVNLYSASSPLMRFRHWPEPPATQPPRAACRHRLAQRPGQAAPVSCNKIPTFRNPYNGLLSYYSFNRPHRDGRLSWPCWLTDSKRFTHIVVTRPSISLAQDRKSSLARTNVLTTMLCHQLSRILSHLFTQTLWQNFLRCTHFAWMQPRPSWLVCP